MTGTNACVTTSEALDRSGTGLRPLATAAHAGAGAAELMSPRA